MDTIAKDLGCGQRPLSTHCGRSGGAFLLDGADQEPDTVAGSIIEDVVSVSVSGGVRDYDPRDDDATTVQAR